MPTVAEDRKKVEASAASPAPADQRPKGFIKDLEDVLSEAKTRASGGSKVRANVGYTLSEEGLKNIKKESISDQQRAILRIMNRVLTEEKRVITEPELHDLIVDAHKREELKTKQDPWHIFRYYRPRMKKTGLLKEVAVEVPADQKKAA